MKYFRKGGGGSTGFYISYSEIIKLVKPSIFKRLTVLREAILQKIPFFYEILSQTGRGGQPDFISLIQKLLSLSNHPSFHSSFHSSKDRFHHILGVNCTNIEFWVALVMIYAVLSNFDFVAKFTVKNQNKDFINAGRGGGVTVLWKYFIKKRYFLKDGFP